MENSDGKEKRGRPLKFESVEVLQEKILAYFESCYDFKRDMFGNRIHDKDNPDYRKPKKGDKGNVIFIREQVKPFTITGLAVYLDTTRDVLLDYESGKYDDPEKSEEENKLYSHTIKRAKQQIYAFAEEALYSGKQAAGPIFNLKNNWGWVDQRDFTSGGRPITPVPLYDMNNAPDQPEAK